MSFCETQIQINSYLWKVVLNSAKTDALTALFMSPKRSLIKDYRVLWPSEIPICDAVINGMVSCGLVPEGFKVMNGAVSTSCGLSLAHTYLLNPSNGYVFDPTSAQFFDPDPENPGNAIYKMMEYNPGNVTLEPSIGLGILFAPSYEVQGFTYDF